MPRWRLLAALLCVGFTLAGAGLAAPAAIAANGHGSRHHKHHGGKAAAAKAARGNPVINDCQSHGQLTHTYTKAQLRHALAVMPASVKQYTNCFDVLHQALISDVNVGSGKAPSTSSGGSSVPTVVIIIIVVLVLAAVTFGGLAIRRRRARPS